MRERAEGTIIRLLHAIRASCIHDLRICSEPIRGSWFVIAFGPVRRAFLTHNSTVD